MNYRLLKKPADNVILSLFALELQTALSGAKSLGVISSKDLRVRIFKQIRKSFLRYPPDRLRPLRMTALAVFQHRC